MIKKLLLPFLGILFTLNVFAQTNKTNLVVFSEDGDKFYLVINGIRQNMKAETNVKVTDLTTENFSFTIIFEDTKIPSIKKTQAMPFGNEYTFRIKDKKGKKSMKYFGETALSAPSNNTSSTTVAYHTTEIPVTTTNVGTTQTGNTTGVSTNTNSSGTGVSTNVNVTGGTNETTTTTTSTSTTTTGGNTTGTTGIGMNVDIKDNTNSEGGNVSTGVNVGGVGMNIDINVSENGANINMGGTGMNTDVKTNETSGTVGTTTTGNTTSGTNVSGSTTTSYSSTTTTTTTTSSSSTGGTGISTNTNVGGTGVSTSTNVTSTGINTGTNTNGNSTSGSTSTYTGTSNYMCGAAMGSTDFATAKKSIESKDFEDSKFTVAKQVTKGNCLSAAQIKEIMEVFDFEATKLDYAKFAYDFCYDKNNYYKLNDAFDFESSVDDLNTYIEKK